MTRLSETTHRQVRARVPQTRKRVWVDEGMAEFLGALWSLGFVTNYSCQGSPDDRPAYIAFAGIEDATCLVEALGLQATTFTQETVLDEFEASYGFCFEPVVEKTLYPEVGRDRGWPITGSVLRVRAELVPVLVQQITDAS